MNVEYYLVKDSAKEILAGNWEYEVQAEHFDFPNNVAGETFTFCLVSINYLDPCFFYNFLKNKMNSAT